MEAPGMALTLEYLEVMQSEFRTVPLSELEKRRNTMPILLRLLGIPIPLIILIMLLHH